ncbi:MAG TPA: transporter, partial [Candidatus Caccomonas pullistercoris]|nr:transporter [Candidatus Caccomonas pullistercoris]
MFLIRFLKNWTLPCAMTAGLAGYFILHGIDALAPLRPGAALFGTTAMPVLIFLMLFFTFNKVDLTRLRPRRWHVELLAVQTAACGLLAGAAVMLEAGSAQKITVEAALA